MPIIPNEPVHDERRRYTVLEILIMLFVIGLVSVFAGVAVNAARSRQRDATRLSDVRQVQSALEDYFGSTNTYPSGTALPLGDAAASSCLGSNGFNGDCSSDATTFLRTVSSTINTGLKGLVACGSPLRNAFCYSQLQGGNAYAIQFELENALPQAGLAKGINCATPNGMSAGACH